MTSIVVHLLVLGHLENVINVKSDMSHSLEKAFHGLSEDGRC